MSQQLYYVRQELRLSRQRAEAQLRDHYAQLMVQNIQQTTKQLHDLMQQKEQEIHDLTQQKEEKEHEITGLRQQKEQELHDLRQQKEQEIHDLTQQKEHELTDLRLGCVTGYQVIRVIRIFAKTYPFEWQLSATRKNRLVNFIYSK